MAWPKLISLDPSPRDGTDTDLKNLALLVLLRWLAFAGQLLTIAFVTLVMGIDLPLAWMGLTLLALVVLNLVSLRWLKRGKAPRLAWVLLVDMLLLTVQLGLSGGGYNPFTALYLLQVTLAAVLLEPRESWGFVGLTAVLIALLSLVHLPLHLPQDEAFFPIYFIGMLIALTLDAILIAAFASRANSNLRARDARLAALRQQAAEEDHIVRMGLLASGAAHELGTPLASISVILSDWRAMPAAQDDPEMQRDIAQMQKAVARCKDIVTGILMSSGEARGEALVQTSVHAFIGDVTRDWVKSRGLDTLCVDNHFGEDVRILADASLAQLVTTLLDNAAEASPDWIGLSVARAGDAGGMLELRIEDRGPGFAPEILQNFGTPYNSTKDRPGHGLGLFLVVNAIRKLGGNVTAGNRAGGGAVITLRLPLDRLSAVTARKEIHEL